CDVEFIKLRQEGENYRFDITELGGTLAKHDRIRRLVPLFETGRIYIQDVICKLDWEGREIDLVGAFVEEEYKPFPVGLHEDMLDALSRICDSDLSLLWPRAPSDPPERYALRRRRRVISPWAA
ncbi:MAG TPA: hypothetical protein VNE82_08640, partial [Candidatus Binataceae bacterium]|nr:hypothetical protein [Candidatus Binataceae bacterium]